LFWSTTVLTHPVRESVICSCSAWVKGASQKSRSIEYVTPVEDSNLVSSQRLSQKP
jgi:hypothetical protein